MTTLFTFEPLKNVSFARTSIVFFKFLITKNFVGFMLVFDALKKRSTLWALKLKMIIVKNDRIL